MKDVFLDFRYRIHGIQAASLAKSKYKAANPLIGSLRTQFLAIFDTDLGMTTNPFG